MTVAIDDLTSATALAAADQVPFAPSGDRTTKKFSLTLLLAWLQANLVFTSAKPVQQFAAPTTGQTVTVATGDSWLILSPAGTLAALTINLPTNRTDGQTVLINTFQTLTALTISGAGTAVSGAPTTLAATAFLRMRYSATLNTWIRTE